MSENRSGHFIPPRPVQREKRVGIYCRVSSNSMEQLNSLTNQVSALTRLTATTPNWLLVDTYIDIVSGKTKAKRNEFIRMLEDCQANNLEIVITKNISRFGRDTVEVLESLNKLKEYGVRVIGVVRLLNSSEHEEHYVSENNHPAIISKEQFEAVQEEKKKRSNVVKDEDVIKRKGTKYSSKRNSTEQPNH